MELPNKTLKNFKVDLTFFQQRGKLEIWVECKVTFHLQSTDVVNALSAALLKLEMFSYRIEDAKIEREL